jgi:hypothetical protein
MAEITLGNKKMIQHHKETRGHAILFYLSKKKKTESNLANKALASNAGVTKHMVKLNPDSKAISLYESNTFTDEPSLNLPPAKRLILAKCSDKRRQGRLQTYSKC